MKQKLKNLRKKTKRHYYSDNSMQTLRRSGRYIPSKKNYCNKLNFLERLSQPYLLLEKNIFRPVDEWLDRFYLIRIAEKLGFIIALFVFVQETGSRREKTIYEAWQIIQEGQGSQYRVVVLAVEQLNKENFSLSGMNLSKTNLSQANLKKANLGASNLEGAYLLSANLEDSYYTDQNTSPSACQILFEYSDYPCPTIFPDDFNPEQAKMNLITSKEEAMKARDKYLKRIKELDEK